MSNEEPISSYTDRFPGHSRQFTLYRDRIVIRGREQLGSEFEIPYVLGEINPGYGTIRRRSAIAGPGALILGGLFGFLFVFGLFQGRPEFFPIGAAVNCVLALACLVTGIRNIRRIELYTFRTRGGSAAFDIARSGPYHERFEQFVGQLIDGIRTAQSSTASEPPNHLLPGPDGSG